MGVCVGVLVCVAVGVRVRVVVRVGVGGGPVGVGPLMVTLPLVVLPSTELPPKVTFVGLPPRLTKASAVLPPPVPHNALKRIVASTNVPLGFVPVSLPAAKSISPAPLSTSFWMATSSAVPA